MDHNTRDVASVIILGCTYVRCLLGGTQYSPRQHGASHAWALRIFSIIFSVFVVPLWHQSFVGLYIGCFARFLLAMPAVITSTDTLSSRGRLRIFSFLLSSVICLGLYVRRRWCLARFLSATYAGVNK